MTGPLVTTAASTRLSGLLAFGVVVASCAGDRPRAPNGPVGVLGAGLPGTACEIAGIIAAENYWGGHTHTHTQAMDKIDCSVNLRVLNP